jgi:hypothetical protein
MERICQDDLAKLLGVEVRTLRQWRQSDFEGQSLHLPAHRDKKTSRSYYLPEDVIAFCKRNPRYGARLIALAAPEPVQQLFLPNAVVTQQTAYLRKQSQPATNGAGLLGIQQ